MRPVNRGASPIVGNFKHYTDAANDLHSRIGGYCSYCERRIEFLLAVEHIHAKALPQYSHLERVWVNFLFGCVNCNGTKGHKDVDIATVLLPDRDNTFLAFEYHSDGKISVCPTLNDDVRDCAARTLELVGLDRAERIERDSNLNAVARDRVAQRKKVWQLAKESADDLLMHPIDALRRTIVKLAVSNGFFSVWMKAFEHDADMRYRLLSAFNGTILSGCFTPITTRAISPAPNPDGLPNGGKV